MKLWYKKHVTGLYITRLESSLHTIPTPPIISPYKSELLSIPKLPFFSTSFRDSFSPFTFQWLLLSTH